MACEKVDVIVSVDPGALTLTVVVVPHPGAEIQRIVVADHFGVALGELHFDCPGATTAQALDHLGPIGGSRLPLGVSLTYCNSPSETCVVASPYMAGDPMMGDSLDFCAVLIDTMPSTGCTAAQDNLTRLRTQFGTDCIALRDAQDELNIDLSAAGVCTGAAITACASAAAATSTVYGSILGAVLGILCAVLGAIAAALWDAVGFAQAAVATERVDLASTQTLVDAAIHAVQASCCPNHILIQLNEPSCV